MPILFGAINTIQNRVFAFFSKDYKPVSFQKTQRSGLKKNRRVGLKKNGHVWQRGGCYMRRAKHNIPSSTKATGSFL